MSNYYDCFISKSNINNSLKMSKNALVLLADGAEDMELVIVIDILRRGDVAVTVAGVPDNTSKKCKSGLMVCPDAGVLDAKSKGPYDVVVLPGGLAGAKVLASDKLIGEILREQEKSGRIVAAICAAPALAFPAHGIAMGKKVTSYPSFAKELSGEDYHYSEEKVVVDGNITTSRSPATAFDFALSLVLQLMGKEKVTEVAKALLYEL